MNNETAQPNDTQTEVDFDYAAWASAENAKEQTARAGTPTQAPAQPAKTEPKPGTPAPAAAAKKEEPVTPAPNAEDDEDQAQIPKGFKRRLRQLERENAEARGRLAAYDELIKQGFSPTQAARMAPERSEQSGDVKEPKREDFSTDLDFLTAHNKYQFAKHQSEQRAQQAADNDHQSLMAEVDERSVKFREDIKLFPDWDQVAEKMADVAFDSAKHPTLTALIGLSDQRAAVMYHFALHPDVLKTIMAMPEDRQHVMFHRLEGQLGAMLTVKADKIADDARAATKIRESTASRDAKKAAPSESVAASGGQETDGIPAMSLSDGTLNPVWKAWQNEKDGLRR